MCRGPSWHQCGVCVTLPHAGKIETHIPWCHARVWAAAGQRLWAELAGDAGEPGSSGRYPEADQESSQAELGR